MPYTIYCHTHVESGRRYVGLTKHSMLKRWSRHVYGASRTGPRGWGHFANAIRVYGKEAFSHEVLEVCVYIDVANLAEECWVEFYDTRNPEKGFNISPGGAHAPHPIKNPWDRPGFREKHAINHKRATSSPDFAAKASRSSKEMWKDPAIRERISLANQSYTFTQEHKKKLADSRRGVETPQSTRDKLSAAQKGKPRNPESIAKSAASRKGIEFSPEHRANISASQVGKRHTPEHVQKVRAALLAKPMATHCKRGHSLEDAYKTGGRRLCRVCTAARCVRYHAKKCKN